MGWVSCPDNKLIAEGFLRNQSGITWDGIAKNDYNAERGARYPYNPLHMKVNKPSLSSPGSDVVLYSMPYQRPCN
jgi:hypothetical protein